MPRYSYETLSAMDNAFLLAEGPTTPMHVSAIQLFEAGPLSEDGGIDVTAIRHAYESVLHLVPRYRQKLAWIPLASRAVWVDDPHFQIDYHIRHVALPHPGGLEELKRVASRVLSYPLDRNHPLWELWVVEGLRGDRFATIAKTHHCMIDGASGVEIAQKLFSPTPEVGLPEPHSHIPRTMPSGLELLRDHLQRQATLPLRLVRGMRQMSEEIEDLSAELSTRFSALGELFGKAMSPASDTPLNGTLSPHRRFDWCTLPLADLKAVRKALDCSLNDVVLGTVTESLRRYLKGRQVDVKDLCFRASTPVSVRSEGEKQQMGNRVSSWLLDLPIDESDRVRQIDRLKEKTRELKRSRQALGIDMLMSVAELAPSGMVSVGSRLASGPINTIVTNVPGPQFPLYLLGARLLAMYPQVPLIQGIGLGIALVSYDGRVFWGFTADSELVPDLEDFVASIDESFAELAELAGVKRTQLADDPPLAAGGRRSAE
jgi:diacylglycerol O-acyltransferase